MRSKSILLFAVLILVSCAPKDKNIQLMINRLGDLYEKGNFDEVRRLTDSINFHSDNNALVSFSDSLGDIAKRIIIDFPYSERQIIDQISIRLPGTSTDDISRWEQNGWLEWRYINGEKRYFTRAASNLVLIKEFNLNRPARDSSEAADRAIIFRKSHTEKIIGLSDQVNTPVLPVEMEVLYTLTVEPDAVPDGEIVRCWLPFPKDNNLRQNSVYLLGISNEDFILSPDSSVHRSIYMENRAEKGKPVVFQIAYSYSSAGQYFNPAGIKPQPYDRKSVLFRKYTSEQLPHICFTERIKRLTDSIAGNEQDPLEITRKIYLWISQNIPWAGALEYSIMPNIPEYVLDNLRGDCGMQTFLFMSMLRYKGIPVKWQSGWMVPPDNKNLHDWCEIYFEGTGWVPADMSYGLQYSTSRKTREFYITGIDSYRLIVNDGVAGDLFPAKKFLRSEPYDFQRGEVEWKGGNLYFDKWDYEMKIIYK